MDRRISAPCALVAVVLGSLACAKPAAADPVPPGWEARNFAPVGYSTVGDRKGAFKMALKRIESASRRDPGASPIRGSAGEGERDCVGT